MVCLNLFKWSIDGIFRLPFKLLILLKKITTLVTFKPISFMVVVMVEMADTVMFMLKLASTRTSIREKIGITAHPFLTTWGFD